jgi:hypothetical protein
MVRQQTWQESKTEISSRRRWTADVGIASAISKPGVFARRSVSLQVLKRRTVAIRKQLIRRSRGREQNRSHFSSMGYGDWL